MYLFPGIAFSQKYLKTGNVTYAYMGDGAANQGQVYEVNLNRKFSESIKKRNSVWVSLDQAHGTLLS